MKRALLMGATLVAAFALGGCPIYPDQGTACASNADCGSGYVCDSSSGLCEPASSGSGGGASGAQCSKPSDCLVNETCGTDGQCHTGDCTFSGCVQGYQCEIANQTWMCVASNGAAGASGAGGSGGAAGSTGTGGTAGTTGTGGTAGVAGSAGTPGAAGAAGTSGSGGTAGTSGTGGTAGATGAAGASGVAGADAGQGGAGGQSDAGTPADASAD